MAEEMTKLSSIRNLFYTLTIFTIVVIVTSEYRRGTVQHHVSSPIVQWQTSSIIQDSIDFITKFTKNEIEEQDNSSMKSEGWTKYSNVVQQSDLEIRAQETDETTVPMIQDITSQNIAGEQHGTTSKDYKSIKNIYTDPMNPVLQAELRRRLQNATKRKIILVWHPKFGEKNQIDLNTTNCGNCIVTYDHQKITDKSTGAVIFHFDAILINRNSMPQQRNPDQLHIFWDLEGPPALKVLRHMTLKNEDSYGFNATMTYRRDSDFYYDYLPIPLVKMIGENQLSLRELLKWKTKMGVAIVSNCRLTPGATTRIKMLKRLKELNFGLETYGNCFPENGTFAKGANRYTEKFRLEVRKYKFYFAYENSHHCKDYITEKFFNNALYSLAVPVVCGAKKQDYEAVAPPGSFIFLEDFHSLEKLVEYLNYLDKNDTAYLEYLRWITMRPNEMPYYARGRDYCAVCRALYGINIDDMYNPNYNASKPARPLFTDRVSHRTVPSLSKWFFGTVDEECFRP